MPTTEFDAIDLRILEELQQDARLTNVELASRVNLSPSPCLSRVRAMEKKGVIRQHVTLMDPIQLGLSLNVFIQISLDNQNRETLDRFERAIGTLPEVMECYLMTGGADYLIRVVVRDMTALERLLLDKVTRVAGVSNIRSSFALKQVRYKTALPLHTT